MIKGKYEDSSGMTTRLGGTENELYLMTVRVDVDEFEGVDEPHFHEPLVILTQDEFDNMINGQRVAASVIAATAWDEGAAKGAEVGMNAIDLNPMHANPYRPKGGTNQ